LFLDAAAMRARDEVHVLEQMRHPRFAVPFVTRADEVGDVDGDRAAAGIGEQQYAQAVGIGVLRDSRQRSAFLNASRQRLRPDNPAADDGGGGQWEKATADSVCVLHGVSPLFTLRRGPTPGACAFAPLALGFGCDSYLLSATPQYVRPLAAPARRSSAPD